MLPKSPGTQVEPLAKGAAEAGLATILIAQLHPQRCIKGSGKKLGDELGCLFVPIADDEATTRDRWVFSWLLFCRRTVGLDHFGLRQVTHGITNGGARARAIVKTPGTRLNRYRRFKRGGFTNSLDP